MERVTMADVANKANVSKSTVSQYINNRFEYMSLETKKRIECAIEELNYQPNIIARSLKQKRHIQSVLLSRISCTHFQHKLFEQLKMNASAKM